ncbi:TPR repeat-containing protein [Haloferula helveola]|uniref:TPR repeat-containing protein n=1 Tax=Haloferula helveola TaxID=490095 RepID=A0ABN6H9Z0_9BACT|nr:TPR repeat-containing protein [Haloferula helveola]
MKRISLLAGAVLLGEGPSRACGPFFADTVLDVPYAALDVPPVSYLHELAQLMGTDALLEMPGSVDRLAQIPLEVAELEELWRAEGVDAKEIGLRSALYEKQRKAILLCFYPDGWATQADKPEVVPPAQLMLDDRFPKDVVDYLEGARRLASGDKKGAHKVWEELCARPANERKLRGVWAAWMLASTATDRAEAVRWHREVIAMRDAGAEDVLGLVGGSYGWLSTLDEEIDPVERIRLTYAAVKAGNTRCLTDLRRRSAGLAESQDDAVLAAAARDPEVRRLVNIEIYARFDGPRYAAVKEAENHPFSRWIEALGANAAGADPDASRIAWALYSRGRFEEAGEWLERAVEGDARAAWLRGKLALREGRFEDAEKEFAVSVDGSRMEKDAWHPDNPSNVNLLWYDSGDELRSLSQGRLLADLGSVALSRGEYTRALDSLLEGGFWEDAAYVAEWVLSSDELREHLEEIAPEWSPQMTNYWAGKPVDVGWGTYRYDGPIDPARYNESLRRWDDGPYTPLDSLRYLLGRRLAREWRFDDAREWMPASQLPLFDHYVALHRARLSGRYRGETRAVIGWRQACIHRDRGMALFGTESAPDGGVHGGSFEAEDFAATRLSWAGDAGVAPGELFAEEEAPVLPVSVEEIRRVRSHQLPVGRRHRFHYRFTAAEIAAKAAAELPRNHPQLAAIYNSAGLWISNLDAKTADPYYQLLVRRCAGTEEGRRADERRWFLPDLDRPAEWRPLPEALRPKPLEQLRKAE